MRHAPILALIGAGCGALGESREGEAPARLVAEEQSTETGATTDDSEEPETGDTGTSTDTETDGDTGTGTDGTKESGDSGLTGGGEGCTPGYWKQPHHFDDWESYTPDTPFGDVFADVFEGSTLVQVLRRGGGMEKALGRHAVAALLNAASGSVSYDYTPAQVIEAFDKAVADDALEDQKNDFEAFNEQGCPL